MIADAACSGESLATKSDQVVEKLKRPPTHPQPSSGSRLSALWITSAEDHERGMTGRKSSSRPKEAGELLD